ncbi:Protoporphyrinogen oxidase [Tistlia consotensis]|uniref:Protoporphyrinogen oxidase n=1 Tax=Tistlia consotensis USBA 355 TaxID=560819 RepID=A0A1Y6B8S7_9PROT|nr:NAD(P)-binding protein [Tistlia consotensis]SME98851.1 Protoporphyrinogen oxidase [Tistlia consotensis USBA 355]SNR58278.1 Protoporphyrinogen oxidase [Tistlia consotensis]
MKFQSHDFCIVGAGPAGLTLAQRLTAAGKSVLIVERNDRPGGLSKSYDYDGHIFDTGPKRFHTDDPIVKDFITEVLAMHEIGRSTLVHFADRYFNWPLKSSELWKMPPQISVRAALDMVRKKKDLDLTTFRDYIRLQYGDTLYNIFFKPYTQKFLRWSADDIHSDWASTGINRTVIDERVKANSLFDLLKGLTLPKKIDTKFLYPMEGGFGGFFDRLFDICESTGCLDFLPSDSIAAIEDKGDAFQATTRGGRELAFETLIWTGNLNDLAALVGDEAFELKYLNTIFFNVIAREEAVRNNRAQWIYMSRGDSLVSRITCMREFHGSTTPAGYYNFICEVTDSQSEPRFFDKAQGLTDPVLAEMEAMKFLKSRRGVEAVHVNPVVDTYPIYHRRYKQAFGGAVRTVKGFSRRVHLLGRSGAYWYNNSDHSIRMALDFAEKLLRDPERHFDHRQYFGGSVKDEHSDEHLTT